MSENPAPRVTFEVGEKVVFRSLQWEVGDGSTEEVLTLFGRDALNRGRRQRVLVALEDIRRAEVPPLSWTLGGNRWDALQWRALHDAFRLTLAHGRGNLASADWGRLILGPYQLVPLRRIEKLPFPCLLIADDTGLGKTAEAGLILFRLLQKRRADRVLILCRARPEPERWRDELKEKFGLEFTVINDGSDYARVRREVPSHHNVFGHLSRIVMSMHFAAPSERGTHIADDLARVRWDVVIIDEAHHVAEHGSGRKRLGELARIVAERSEALLLLTATPHDGKAESYASLVRLLDPYLAVDPDRLSSELVRPLVVRRLKSRVIKSDGGRFLPREVHPLGKYRNAL